MLLAPWALWFGAVGAAVIALYVLKIKRRRQHVPALEFWTHLAGSTKAHSLFQRLKRLLSMLLWFIIATCLVLALGNPILSFGRIEPRAIAVIIDNSASMQTMEDDTRSLTRLDLARAALNDLTTRRPVTDEWMLIVAGRSPHVLQPWTYNGKAVRTAAEQIRPFAGASELTAASQLATQLLAGKDNPTIVVVSDRPALHMQRERTTADDERTDEPEMIVWPVGATRDNLGITRLAARLNRLESNYHVLVQVFNASSEPVESQLTFAVDGSAVNVELISVQAESTWEKVIVLDAPTGEGGAGQGGVLHVTLDRPDALMLDNEAYAILKPIRPAVVWLVTPMDEAFFFEQALAAMDDLVWAEESLTLTLDQYGRAIESLSTAADADTASLRPPDLIIFNNAAPDRLPSRGRFMLINDWPNEIAAAVDPDQPLTSPQLFLTPRAHALTRYVTLDGAQLARARHVTLNEPAEVLAHTADGDPLIFLVEHVDQRAVCLAFDVFESDLPLRNAFPLLLRNAVSFLHAEAPSWIRDEYAIGDTVYPIRPMPDGVDTVQLTVQRENGMTTTQVAVHDRQFTIHDTADAGAMRVTFSDEVSFAAINLTDEAESQIAPIEAAADPRETLVLSGRLLGTMPWIGFAFAATALVALEWLTYNFRWTE